VVAASAPANRLEDIPREAPAGGPPHDGFDPSREVAVRLPVSRTVPDRPASAADPCFAPATALTGGARVDDGPGPARGHPWVADHPYGFRQPWPNATGTTATLPDLAPRVRPEAPGRPAFAARRVVDVPDPSPKSAGVVRPMLDRAG